MSIHYKHSQIELFPGIVHSNEKNNRPHYIFSSLTLSTENIIILAIILIMSVIFAFSLGVERGKKIVTSNSNALRGTQQKTIKESGRIKPVRLESNVSTMEQASIKNKDLPVQNPAEVRAVVLSKEQESKKAEIKGTYTIQVASYKQVQYAQKEATALEKRMRQEIFVMPKGEHSIVCVGKFSTKAEANNILGKLKNKYKDCLVRRL